MPMCRWSASPAPGFISSIGRLASSSARIDPVSDGAALVRACPLGALLYFSPERILPRCVVGSGAAESDGEQIVPGKKYLSEQAATFLKFAMATTDPDVAAGFLDKAADLSARSEEAPDASPRPPDVEQPEG